MRFFILLMFFVLAACQSPELPLRSTILDMDSLLNTQAKMLGKVSIDKTLQVGDSKFKTQQLSALLQSELGPFREISQVNRPIYRNNYQVIVYPDTLSNLTVKEYRAINYTPVKGVRLFYLGDPSQLKRLEATLSTEDFYQSSKKNFSLNFSLLGDTLKLESYSIDGSQRYFWGTSHHFLVEASIR